MAGPVCCAATVPVSTKMPLPIMAPRPTDVSVPGPSTRLSFGPDSSSRAIAATDLRAASCFSTDALPLCAPWAQSLTAARAVAAPFQRGRTYDSSMTPTSASQDMDHAEAHRPVVLGRAGPPARRCAPGCQVPGPGDRPHPPLRRGRPDVLHRPDRAAGDARLRDITAPKDRQWPPGRLPARADPRPRRACECRADDAHHRADRRGARRRPQRVPALPGRASGAARRPPDAGSPRSVATLARHSRRWRCSGSSPRSRRSGRTCPRPRTSSTSCCAGWTSGAGQPCRPRWGPRRTRRSVSWARGSASRSATRSVRRTRAARRRAPHCGGRNRRRWPCASRKACWNSSVSTHATRSNATCAGIATGTARRMARRASRT